MKQNQRCHSACACDIEAERAVLAVVLLDPRRIAEVAATLEPTDFTDQTNRTIYAAMLRLARRGLPADATLVVGELSDRNRSSSGRGVTVATLVDLFQLFPLAKHLPFYMDRVLEMSRRRDALASQRTSDRIRPSTEP